MLNQKRLKELFKYNVNTGKFTCKIIDNREWYIGRKTYSHGYLSIYIDGRNYKAHRLAWLYVYGIWPMYEIDHINGERADNRIENLREATRSQNMQNLKGAYKCNKTNLLGVYELPSGKYGSRIAINGHQIYLGSFDTAEEAHIAYLAVKRNLHPFNTL